jgi:transposase-like protein
LEAAESPLPPQIQAALGELVGAAREGLLALSVGVGLGVVHELMELEVDEVVGPKGKHDPDRVAKRHGHEDGSMTLGRRRVAVRRPRIRSADDERELPVATYEYFADRDPLTRAVIDRMLAGVSTRKFARVGEPVGEAVQRASSSTSKTAVSDMFIARTRTALGELMSRRLADVRLAVMMLDGLDIADRCHVVALGISTEGVKIPLGLWEGSTENATLARALLADLVDRGLDPDQAILFVIDGGKALRRAIKDVFGEHALTHRCHRHFVRDMLRHCRPAERGMVSAALREIFNADSHASATVRCGDVIERLRAPAPKVAELLEGAEEDLLAFYRFPAAHWPKLRSTNPLERVNREIGRRADVVAIFPNDHSAIRLAGALLIEQNDEWLVSRRYLSEESLALVLGEPEVDQEEVVPAEPIAA